MFKKYVITGLVLLVTGSAVLGWVLTEKSKEQQRAAYYKSKYGSDPDEYLKQYNEWLQLPPEQRANLPWWLDKYGKTKTEAQLQQEQQERLKADLDKLAAGKIDTYPYADILYGENWQTKLNEYKKQRQFREYFFTGSILCAFTGGAIVTCCMVLWIYRILTKASSHLRKSAAVALRGQRPNKDKKPVQADAKAKIKPEAKVKAKVKAETEAKAKVEAERKAKATAEKLAQAKLEAKTKAKAERKAQAEAEKVARAEEKAREKADTEEKVGVESDTVQDGVTSAQQKKQHGQPGQVKKHSKVLRNSGWQTLEANSASHTAVLIPDEKSVELVEALEEAAENMNVSPKLEDSLKEKTENLEKQMAEFKQMAQGVQQTAMENSKPINNTLSELTEQMSAIREYATSQQTRLTKLQDGYDWNIMRTFCLRVIRCIDNLERRISQLTEKDLEAVGLEEVRDEMLFALESSGVEQYEPEINSDYHGQEKYAEAVKDKKCCDDKNRTGKIAKIIRPGYQYFIDEENVKVVRPAQVKLFG